MEVSKVLKTPEKKRKYIDDYIAEKKDTEAYKQKRAETNKRYYNSKKKQLEDALEKLKNLKMYLM